MAIPSLDQDGFLPPGIYDCTIKEIELLFGRFSRSDRRINLFKELGRYFDELKDAGIGAHLIVNGSFVTSKAEPNDIDLILILRKGLAPSTKVPPFEYNPRSKKYVRNKYSFDLFPGFEGDDSVSKMLDIFSRIKERPDRKKGFLRITL